MDGQGILLAALVVIGWSFPGVFVRLMPQLNPWTVALFRLAIGFLFTLPVVLSPRYRGDFKAVVRTPLGWVLATLMFGYYIVATAAFQNAPVGEVAVLIASAPVLALPIRMFFGEKPTLREFVGTALALGGVAFVLTPNSTKGHFPNPYLGICLALSGAFCAAAFATGVRRLTESGRPSNPLAIAAMAEGMGLLALPVALAFTPIKGVLDDRTLWVLPLGILSTAIPTSAYAAASGRLPAVVATMLNPMVAITASVVAAIAIREVPRLAVAPGAALIIAGIYVSTRKTEPKLRS